MIDDRRDQASREAAAVQRRAADPDISVALRASAGSGKTKVLVDRIVRLLLVKAPLKSVVALTFTRKAAVEIKERLRERLGALARLSGDALVTELAKLLGRPPRSAETERAALVFEEVLEDSTGLLVGTIHTFCQTLLKRFADEAGVDPSFAVLENVDDLWDEAMGLLEAEISREPGAAAELARLAPDPAAARKALRTVEKSRLELDRWCDRVADETGATPDETGRASLLPALTVDLAAHVFIGTPLAEIDDPSLDDLRVPAAAAARNYAGTGLNEVLETQTKDPEKLDTELQRRRDAVLATAAALEAGDDVGDALAALFDATLTKAGTIRKAKSGSRNPDIMAAREDALERATAPLLTLRRLHALIDLYHRNVLLLRFGLRALDRYADLKRRDRCLDFHDLERLAWRLVRDTDVGPWILYRLDARLDHLLVDEFQDTNRNQWEVLQPFAEEFVSSEAEDGRPRTAFFVGDVKQSIYGFRGARPRIFGEVESWLSGMTGEPTLTLPTNFRSLPQVVNIVGELFQSHPLSGLLPDGEVEAARQIPCRNDGPGRVLIIEPVSVEDDGDPHEAAAARAARAVLRIVREGRVHENGRERPARFGDVLLLSRTRTHLAAYEHALRAVGIPIVPAGRGALARSREVRDILLLLRWLVFPAEDSALAGVLRSPLFRASEASLQELLALRLARGGGRGSLWQVLRSDDCPAALADATALLDGWLRRVGSESVHRLLRRIYRETRATDRFAAALGEQARYNLLRLHDLALAHGRTAFPSLRGFVTEIERAVVREDQEEAVLPDTEQGRVRMMTIHGAKGLEAPFVLLVDYADPMAREAGGVVLGHRADESGPLVSGLNKTHRGESDNPVATAAAISLDDMRREQANLLYVAMTRARDELIMLGAAPTRNADAPSFAAWINEGPRDFDAELDWKPADDDDVAAGAESAPPGPRVWEPCGWTKLLETISPSRVEAPPLPGDAEPEARLSAPEHADGADAETEAATAREAALAHGLRVHLLLQQAVESGVAPAGAGKAETEAREVFENPEHDWIFRPDAGTALCEAPVIARRTADGGASETRLLGTVDRLLIKDDEIVVIDYKTNRVADGELDEVVAHYRPQMQAYREALAAVFPDCPVRCLLLFTRQHGNGGPGLSIDPDKT